MSEMSQKAIFISRQDRDLYLVGLESRIRKHEIEDSPRGGLLYVPRRLAWEIRWAKTQVRADQIRDREATVVYGYARQDWQQAARAARRMPNGEIGLLYAQKAIIAGEVARRFRP